MNVPATLTAVLRRLAGDPALRSRLAAAGRERAARFSWPAIAEGHHAVYLEALA